MALFYHGGVLGIGSAVSPWLRIESESAMDIFGPGVLASSVISAGDHSALLSLMEVVPRRYQIDLERAQKRVREAFSAPEEWSDVTAGALWRHGAYLRAQLEGRSAPRDRIDRLVWYLKYFADDPDVQKLYYSRLSEPFGILCLIGLAGFGSVIVAPDDILSVPIESESSLIRVTNVCTLLARRTSESKYALLARDFAKRDHSGRISRSLDVALGA
jgi:hypothetical protein